MTRAEPRPSAFRSALPSLLLLGACAAPPPPPITTPAPPPAAPPVAPSPTEAPAAPPAVAPQPAPAAEPAPSKCPDDTCDIQALERCNTTEEARLAAIEQLNQCLRKANQPSRRAAYREAMLNLAYWQGAMDTAAGERLVCAGILAQGQSRTLAAARQEVARSLAGKPAPYDAITSSICRVVEGPNVGGVELHCHLRGECAGGCRRRYAAVTFRVEAARLRVVRLADGLRDDGSCGHCM